MIRMSPASTGDARALTALMLASKAYAGAYHVIIAGYHVTPAMITSNVTRIADDSAGIAGFYSLDVEQGELDLLFVADDRQGAGAGRLIFADMVAVARTAGLTAVRIVAHPPAAGFYRRMGARDVGVVPPMGRVTWQRPELRFDIP